MNYKAMNTFLSEENIRRHEEYLNNLRLKLSILEKSDPSAMRIGSQMKREESELIKEIKSHELFFDSFTQEQGAGHDRERYEIYCRCIERECGFLYIYYDRGIKTSFDMPRVEKCLCIDLFEHCYFLDYGFKKDKFLKNCISHLDLARLLDN